MGGQRYTAAKAHAEIIMISPPMSANRHNATTRFDYNKGQYLYDVCRGGVLGKDDIVREVA